MNGIFGDMFDFNRSGELDAFERAAEFQFLDEMTKDDYEEDEEEDEISELEAAGLDVDELEFMDEDERREALEDAGLDPDGYERIYSNTTFTSRFRSRRCKGNLGIFEIIR